MITPEQEDLISEVVSDASNLAYAHEWGSGVSNCKTWLANSRAALIAELARLNAEKDTIRALANDILLFIEVHGSRELKAHATTLLDFRARLSERAEPTPTHKEIL